MLKLPIELDVSEFFMWYRGQYEQKSGQLEMCTCGQPEMQTCHFDLTQNLNECEKKSEYTEKNLNLTIKIELCIEISTQFKAKKI